MRDDPMHYPAEKDEHALHVGSLRMPGGACVNVSLCRDGNHVVLVSKDTDQDVAVIDMDPDQVFHLAAALRLGALRVLANTAAADELEHMAQQIEVCLLAMGELADGLADED